MRWPGLLAPATARKTSSLEAVEAMRRYGHERRLDAVVRSLVTDHGRPHVAPYTGGVPAAAKRVEKAASAAGFETIVHDENDRTRLVLVESPRGIPYNITELTERISQP